MKNKNNRFNRSFYRATELGHNRMYSDKLASEGDGFAPQISTGAGSRQDAPEREQSTW